MSDLHLNFNRPRIQERTVSELIGLCHGLLADGRLEESEVRYLQAWLQRNADVSGNPVILTLLDRVTEMLVNGVMDAEETRELFDTLQGFIGGQHEIGEVTKSTALPLDDPYPDIVIPGRNFCFTGTFVFGGRKDCESAVMKHGGNAGSLTKKTDYLVIGTYATQSWIHTSFGRKIEKAAQMRRDGIPIRIVCEDHWVRFIQS